ncbi:MAG TPA: YdcF family protein [Candidatus Paceibacterota bacterium]|nr:YdcF family protein [Candidatus Paceibacterota bacterium]
MTTNEAAKVIWDYMLMNQKLEKADAILVLGSSDLRKAEYGAQLYHEGWAPLLIFSGGEGRTTTGLWGMTEAEKFASIAVEKGVPQETILIEKRSTNTGENIQFTRQLLEEKGIHLQKIIVAQKPYMERRTYATFMKQWPGMDFIVTSPKISFEDYPEEGRSIEHIINMMVGDLQRIKEYPALGFQIEQEIPENVWQAYEQLVREGFTEQLIK